MEGTGEEAVERVAEDAVTAWVNARSQGQAVEVASARGEFSSTWVNPDGSFTPQESLGQVRFRYPAEEWVDVDLHVEVLAAQGYWTARRQSSAAHMLVPASVGV